MKRSAVLILVLLAAAALFAPPASAQQSAGCVQMFSGIICPPPNGGVSSDIKGEFVCGPGACARNNKGVVRCSSVSGGSVIVDINGEVLCVGGCIDGRRDICVVPRK